MKKKMSLLVTLMLITGLLSGCGKSGSESKEISKCHSGTMAEEF